MHVMLKSREEFRLQFNCFELDPTFIVKTKTMSNGTAATATGAEQGQRRRQQQRAASAAEGSSRNSGAAAAAAAAAAADVQQKKTARSKLGDIARSSVAVEVCGRGGSSGGGGRWSPPCLLLRPTSQSTTPVSFALCFRFKFRNRDVVYRRSPTRCFRRNTVASTAGRSFCCCGTTSARVAFAVMPLLPPADARQPPCLCCFFCPCWSMLPLTLVQILCRCWAVFLCGVLD